MDVFDLVAKISLDSSEYEDGLDEASKKTNSVGGVIQSAGESISNVGSTLTQNVSVPLLAIGQNMLQTAMEYEAGMDKVQAISGATGSEMALLGDKAMEMAAKTQFSTSESAEAFQYMAMAGWKTEDMLNALDAVMYLAGASGEDLATTSDIVTDAMTAFGLAADGTSQVLKNGMSVEVSNATRFTDVLAAASNNANTNVSMMGESFKFVAPVAGAMGYSVEDVAIALGLMANNGIKASMGGTALRTLLVNLANPTDTMTAAMDALGVSLSDDEGNMYSLMEVLEQLRAGFGGGKMDSEEFAASLSEIETAFESGEMSEEEYEAAINNLAIAMYGAEGAQNAQLAAMLAGKYGMAGLLAIVNATDEDFQSLTSAIYNSNGATEEMYNIMTDNAQGAVTRLDSAINVLFTSLGEFLIPAFTKVVEAVTGVVNWFNSLDDNTKQLILTIGGIAIVVGPILTVVGKIVTGVGGVISAVKLVGTAISGLFTLLAANPITLVIAAIAALVAAFVALWNNCEGFRNFWIGLWEGLKNIVSTVVEVIKNIFGGIVDFFKGVWEGIKNVFSGIGDFFKGAFQQGRENSEKVWEGIKTFFGGVWDGVKNVFSGVGDFFKNAFQQGRENSERAWEGIKTFFGGVWDGVKSVFSTVGNFFKDQFQQGAENAQKIWSGVKDFFSNVWGGIKDTFSTVGNFFKERFQEGVENSQRVWEGTKEFFSNVWGNVKEAFSNVGTFFKEQFQQGRENAEKAWEGIKGFFSNIWDGTKEIFSNVGGFFKDQFQQGRENAEKAWEGIKGFFSNVWEGTKSIFSNVGSFFQEQFQKGRENSERAWDGVQNFFSNVWGNITSVFSNVGSKFLEIGGNIVNGLKNGISRAWSAFTNWVKDKIGGIVSAVKSALGIASPSKVFAEIGGFMAEGLSVGWNDEYSAVKGEIESGLNFSAGTTTVGIAANGYSYGPASGQNNTQSASQSGDTYNFYSPKALDPVSAAREMRKAKQQMALGYV